MSNINRPVVETDMTTTYTVLQPDESAILASGLTAVDAMDAALSYDMQTWEIRREADGHGWRLWTGRSGQRMTETVAFSLANDEAEAEAGIAALVINAAWPGYPEIFSDADYADRQRAMPADTGG